MNIAIAIFAKNPDLSPVKTRLAKDIGTEKAIDIYKQLLKHTEQVVDNYRESSSHTISPYWALAEKESINLPQWQNFNILWTGEGGLGERLHHIYKTLIQKHDIVILIGSDCPHLEFNDFDKHIEIHLQQAGQSIIGPCEDGGFYLFACNQALPESLWKDIRYSMGTTRNELIDKLTENHVSSFLLEELYDLDTQKELIRWRPS